MKAERTKKTLLRCEACGNTSLFEQVIEYEVRLVDGDLNDIRMLAAEVDHYVCHLCGTPVDDPLE